jgi:hypothetical protein
MNAAVMGRLNHALVHGRNDKKTGGEGMIIDINDELVLAARLLLATLFLIFGWRKLRDYSGTAANRVKLLPDDRALQTDLVRAAWIVPIASLAGNRDPGASPPTQYPTA